MLTEFLIRNIFNLDLEIVVPLGTKMQKGTITVVVYMKELWKEEKLLKKIKSIITLSWKPDEQKILLTAQNILVSDTFGSISDFGDKLIDLNVWHNSREWKLDAIQPSDIKKAESLDAFAILIRTRLRDKKSFRLNLDLNEHVPHLCPLIYPIAVKIPIISFEYFLDVHKEFSFNSIRSANHPNADSLISYLYEILYLQQKIAISLYDYSNQVIYSEINKKENLLIASEINAILSADLVFSYLKASIEKIIAFVGLIYNIDNIDSLKTHKSKIDNLLKKMPNKAKEQFYFQFLSEFVKSENLEELNNYRSGILHKKGISDLQPHNYNGENAATLPLRKIFHVLHEQHAKNTAILLCSLALLTDDLVNRKPPDFNSEEIPFNLVIKHENK